MCDEGYNRESFSDFPSNDVEGDMGWTGNRNWKTSAEITALKHATVREYNLSLRVAKDMEGGCSSRLFSG